VNFLKTLLAVYIGASVCTAQSININGIVKDSAGIGIPGATVKLEKANLTTTTKTDGSFTITDAPTKRKEIGNSIQIAPNKIEIRNGKLNIKVSENAMVSVEIHDVSGRLLLRSKKANNFGLISFSLPKTVNGVYICKVTIGKDKFNLQAILLGQSLYVAGKTIENSLPISLAKHATVTTTDVILSAKGGYADKRVLLSNLDTSGISIKMFAGRSSVTQKIGPAGGLIKYEKGDSLLILTIPAGALADTFNFSITPIIYHDSIHSGITYEICPSGLQFIKPAIIRIKYDTSLLHGVDKSRIRIITAADTIWSLVPTTIDSQTQTVSGPIKHLSISDLFLPKTVVSGYVTDPCGRPLSGIDIIVNELPGQTHQPTATTDETGNYVVAVKGHGQYELYPANPNGEKWSPEKYQFFESDDGKSGYDFQKQSALNKIQDVISCCYQYNIEANCWGRHLFKYSADKGFYDHVAQAMDCSCTPPCLNNDVTIAGSDPFAPILVSGGATFTFYFNKSYINTGWNWNGSENGTPHPLDQGTMTPINCQ
jgi:hypothetical protein